MQRHFLAVLIAFLPALSSMSAAGEVANLLIRVEQNLQIAPEATALRGTAPFVAVNATVLEQLRASTPVGAPLRLLVPVTVDQDVVLDLTRFEVFTAGSVIEHVTASGPKPLSAPKSLLLRGSVSGAPESHAMLAIYPTMVHGRIELGGQVYLFTLLPGADGSGSPVRVNATGTLAMSVVPTTLLTPPEPWACGTTDPTSIRKVAPRGSGKGAAATQVSYRQISVALEGDTPYYLDHGSDTTEATGYAEAVIAAVSDIYLRDLGVTMTIGRWKLWATTDPYTGTTSGTLLSQFRSYWRSNNSSIQRTIAHLFSGENEIGGVAYLDGLCSTNNGYAVSGLNSIYTYPRSTYAWDTDVTAHEIGHNVGSPHTHSCTWSPAIDSCYTAEGSCFTGSKAVKGTIMSYCHLTNQGKVLAFHQRCIDLMDGYITDAACMPLAAFLTANAGPDQTVCGPATVFLEGSIDGGTEPFQIIWRPNAGMTDSTTLTPSFTATTTNNYILEVRDATNTVARDTVRINVNPGVTVSLKDTTDVCKGSSVSLTVGVSGGTAPFSYRWNIDGRDTITTTATITYTPTAFSTVRVQVVDSKACSGFKISYVRVNTPPKVKLTAPTNTLCADDVTVLKPQITGGTKPFTYEWWTKDGLYSTQPDSLVVSPDSTMFYKLKLLDARGCLDTVTVTIKVHDIQFAVTPDKLDMGTLGACQTKVDSWITITNSGSEALKIDSIPAKYVKVTSKDFPLTVPPNSTHLLPIQVILPQTSPIVDTLRIRENVCHMVKLVAFQAQRGSIAAWQDPEAAPGNMFKSCTQPTQMIVNLVFDNQAGRSAIIRRAESRIAGASATLQGAPITVASKQKAKLVVHLVTPLPVGVLQDTIDLTYESENCTSKVAVPITMQGIEVTMNMPDTLSFGDTSNQNPADQVLPVTITPEFTGLTGVVISGVSVTGPFSTTLSNGTPLQSTSPINTTVTFHPSQAQGGNPVKGTLAIKVDSCQAPYQITLLGLRHVISAVEELEGGLPVARIEGTRLVVRPEVAHVTVIDVRGAVVAEGSASDGLDVSGLAEGLYVVVLTEHGGRVSARTMIIQ
jgi:hypothetical protein